jgi:hypothetical protein
MTASSDGRRPVDRRERAALPVYFKPGSMLACLMGATGFEPAIFQLERLAS